jgi:dethiobiotin synthetase
MDITELSTSRAVRIAIVGTGTGVGKTHLSVALLHALRLRGCSAVGLKPVESGVDGDESASDTSRLAAASMFHVKHPAPYRFPDPVSPHLAARRVGVEIQVDRIVNWVAQCAAPWTIVETAGGLLSPLARGTTNLDLIAALAPDVVVLVGVDRLGTLHDVGACLFALAKGLAAPVDTLIVLQAPEVADRSTGTNADELVTLGIASHVTLAPRGGENEPPVAAAMATLLRRIELSVGARCFT